MGPSNDMFLKYTVSLPAGSYDDLVYDDLYNEQLKEGIPGRDGVELASFKFSGYKYDQFSQKLLSELFGIFAGTSILTNYLLMITYFPAVVALHEKWVLKYAGGQTLDGVSAVLPTELASEHEDAELLQAAPTAQRHGQKAEKQTCSEQPCHTKGNKLLYPADY
ncbi:Protein dispatched 1 [Desmophyllum pertusum]|uniref:Protein dispatched 1 n=1 Tax=Desmophyllum pertusum TaxID=174260 RepID=A0A9W9Z808_9CNID|nr:Protein dispatched 1 [Desmophyllum pertusum]